LRCIAHSLDRLVDFYAEALRALLDRSAIILLLETIFDMLSAMTAQFELPFHVVTNIQPPTVRT